jgi:hypothetical protein
MRETTASFLKALCAISPDSAGTTDRDLMASTRPVSFRPPDMSGVTERPPAAATALLAHYWREALAYFDFGARALTGKRQIKPLGIHTVEETGRMA